MKKIYSTLVIVLACYYSYAQNTFPSSGNVGIGTLSPVATLDVNGNGRYTSYLQIGGAAVNSNSTKLWINNGLGDGKNWALSSGANMITEQGFHIYNWTDSPTNPLFTINNVGNVGIGTTSPGYKLDVNGGFHTVGTSELGSGFLHVSTDQSFSTAANYTFRDGVGINNPNGSSFATGTSVMSVGAMSNGVSLITIGNVGIGTIDPQGYKLAVNGNAIAESVTVKLHTNWPDYVFRPTYKLPSLLEVKNYIDKNCHLPEMPSEQEVADHGINLGEIVKLQTKKIEELTLYLIDQQKTNQSQQVQLKQQQEQINQLKEQLTVITKALTKN